MKRISLPYYKILMLLVACFGVRTASAQNKLEYTISLNIKQIKIATLLTEIGKRGGFFFSYGSDMVPADSLVTVNVSNKPIRLLLDQLFNNDVAYKEAPGYIILRPAPNRLKLMPDAADDAETAFNISGYVVDDETGAPVRYASVYENRLLVSTLTDDRGYFKLKLKSVGAITLTVSKEMYKDTSVSFLSKVTVVLKNTNFGYAADTGASQLNRSWLGRLLISSKLRQQSANIGQFITNVPVQTSFIPGWGNHGLMSGQIVNKFSLNILSGYSAGVDGLELAGLYNLNKNDVRYVQVAGLFSVVGGNFKGVQLAGLDNKVYKDVKGVQVAGLFNRVDNAAGVQLAGIANINKNVSSGVQVAGILNIARKMQGVHVGVINIADTLDGVAVNLISFSRSGYHQLSVFTDDNMIATLGYKTGTAAFYTRLTAGVNLVEAARYYTYGFSFGHDFEFKKNLMLSAEFNTQFLLSDKWNDTHQLNRFSALLNVPVAKKLSVFLGPSFTLYDQGQNNTVAEQQAVVKNHKLALTGLGSSFKCWIGWSVGINLF